MRFKITFAIDRKYGDCLPINYQYEQSALIYKVLSHADAEYSAWLHDNGFRLDNGKHFKLFCYSRFKFEQYRIMPKAGCINVLGDKIEWMVSFLPEKSTAEFVHGLFANQHVVIGNRDYRVALDVVDVEIQPAFEYKEVGLFRTLSPICVSQMEQSRKQYLHPSSSNYPEAILSGLQSRYEAISGHRYQGENLCRMEWQCEPKAKLITIKSYSRAETKVKGYDGVFTLHLPEPLMHIAYEAGLGEQTGIGFGMIETI